MTNTAVVRFNYGGLEISGRNVHVRPSYRTGRPMLCVTVVSHPTVPGYVGTNTAYPLSDVTNIRIDR